MKRKYKAFGALFMSLAMAVTIVPAADGKAAEAAADYEFDNSYSIGYKGGVVAYKDGKSMSLADAGVPTYAKKDDNPFGTEIEQAWNAEKLTLTRPVQYTTEDGKVHDVESMLTNFDFIADPTAIDNSAVDGKLYVYGTTEGIDYDNNGNMAGNGYNNHSLTILSSSDMVNWTDEGFCDTQNLTNETSDSDSKVKNKWATKAWAPSGLAFDGDGDGKDEYYLFHTNSGAVGYVMSDSPTGPWRDPLGKTLFAGVPGVKWCFDPAVLRDDKGNAYCYFGGGIWDGANEKKDHPDGIARPKTGRVCKLGFDENGEVFADGEPQEMNTFYLFEDSEINQFNGKYYYSYCANFQVPASEPLVKSGSIAVYVSSDPMDIAFDPYEDNRLSDAYTDEATGVYHHYLGTILDNPSVIYGQSYNNHHHMQSFKGHNYIFYHSTVLNNSLHRESHSYRNLHVDEIDIDENTDAISIEPSYEGAKQIENFDLYRDFNKKDKYINATTTSYSAGVNSVLSDELTTRVNDGDNTSGGSPMALDNINTGDWTKIQGADLGNGPVKFEAVLASTTDEGAIEVFVDSPTKASNKIATLKVTNTGDIEKYESVSIPVNTDVSGVHDLYFVFRGSDYRVASWKFEESSASPAVPSPSAPAASATATPTSAPTATPTTAPAATDAPKSVDTSKTYKVGGSTYKITDAKAATVNYVAPAKKSVKSVSIPATVKIEGITYKVTGIAAKAFKGCSKLSKVTVGKNVKMIGAKAFNGCKSLKKIDVKSTVLKKVGAKAFSGINAKAAIKVPKKQLKAYKKVLKGKGQGKKVRIK